MNRIFNSEIECSNEVQRLKLLQKHHLRPEVIPPELANSSQWVVWAYEVGERKNGKFGPDKIAYQARNPWLKSSRWHASDWSDLTTALQCVKDNSHIDGIGYFFSKNDGLIGVDFDNCRDPKTGKIRKEYQFWIDKLNGYTEVSPSGTGIKVWVKGTIDSKYFRNDESTGFRIQNFAGGTIEIYRRGQYFTVTTQFLEGFEYIKPAQEELDVLSEFSHSRTHNTLSGGWVSGEHVPIVAEDVPEGAKVRLGKGSINDIKFSPDGTRLAVASTLVKQGKVIAGIWIYAAHSGEELNLIKAYPADSVQSIAFSDDGSTVAGGGQSHGSSQTLHLWDVVTGKHLKTFMGCTDSVTSVVFSPDSAILASGGQDQIYLWDVNTGQLQKTLKGHNGFVYSVVFSPDGSMLASGSYDETICLWDVNTGQLQKTLKGHNSIVNSLCFIPDGITLASGSGCQISKLFGMSDHDDDTVRLWNVSTGMMLQTLAGHTSVVTSVSFSPDGHLLASGSEDKTVRLWDVTTGKPRKIFIGHKQGVRNVAFSPDGRTLASGGRGTVLLWSLDAYRHKDFRAPGSTPNIVTGRTKTIAAKEKVGFQNRESRIQQICTERGITTLVHFTRIENLQSILWNGLLGRETLEKRLQEGSLKLQKLFINDNSRWDKHKEAICVSISFPNHLMFSSIRKQKRMSDGISDSRWVVLVLEAKILWELACVFCPENAASNAIRHVDLEERRQPDILEGMFVDVYTDIKKKIYRRNSPPIPVHYPTHPQAEVLVFDPIPITYIQTVHFYDASVLEQWCSCNPWINPERLVHDQQYFRDRPSHIGQPHDNLDDWNNLPF